MTRKSIWQKVFALPSLPTLLITTLALALHVYVFRTDNVGALRYLSYTLSTYALILLCTGYARLVQKDKRWGAPFTLSLIPTLIAIILGTGLLIYVYTADNYGPISYVAYLVSAYAFVLTITGYVRLAKLSGRNLRATDGKGVRWYKQALSAVLMPFVQTVAVNFQYVMVKRMQGIRDGSVGKILLAFLSMIVLVTLAVLPPLFFIMGILCIFVFQRKIRGVVLCSLALIGMVLTSHLAAWITERHGEEIHGI